MDQDGQPGSEQPGRAACPPLVGYELEDDELDSPSSPVDPSDKVVPLHGGGGGVASIPLPGEELDSAGSVVAAVSDQLDVTNGKFIDTFIFNLWFLIGIFACRSRSCSCP